MSAKADGSRDLTSLIAPAALGQLLPGVFSNGRHASRIAERSPLKCGDSFVGPGRLKKHAGYSEVGLDAERLDRRPTLCGAQPKVAITGFRDTFGEPRVVWREVEAGE